MSKKEFIHLLQFILIRIFVRAFITFALVQSFLDFVLKYWLYIIIVSVSYFYYYSIQYDTDKKSDLIRNVLICWNVYLFLHIFFRPQLNISHQLFVLLWLIILGIWWTTKLKSRWKYLLQIMWWIFSFFILISGIFYFYPDGPDIQWFLNKRNVQIVALWVSEIVEKSDAYIQIVDTKGTKEYEIRPNFSKNLTENVKIAYPSLNTQRNERIIIITPQGDLLWVFPQSEVQLQISWNNLENLSKLNWKIWFLSGVLQSWIKISWEIENLTPEQNMWLESVQYNYKYELVSYLKKQISQSNISRANNTVMYNIDGKIIKILSRMFPSTFTKNLHNYEEFQRYFSLIDEWEINLGRFSSKYGEWDSISSILWNMKDNIDIWKNNTYGRFKKPEKR